LQGIPKEKRQHALRSHGAHQLFQCFIAAIRPLDVEELAEIFAIDFDPDAPLSVVEVFRPENAEEAVLSACSTLIVVINDEGSNSLTFQ
jgi:hypothetical protein